MSVAFLAFLVWLAAVPLMGQIKKTSERYLENETRLAVLDRKETLFRELKHDYQNEESTMIDAADFFLESDEIVSFISTLETIASETGNTFEIQTAISHEPSEREKESYLTLRIGLWGNFATLMDFIASLEDSPYSPYRLMQIDNLIIKETSGSEETSHSDTRLKADIGIKVYTK